MVSTRSRSTMHRKIYKPTHIDDVEVGNITILDGKKYEIISKGVSSDIDSVDGSSVYSISVMECSGNPSISVLNLKSPKRLLIVKQVDN